MTCADTYERLRTDRDIWLQRARDAGRLTLPWLIAEDDEYTRNRTTTKALPWNGIGQRGVLNICSRLTLALLPPTEAFFRFTVDEVEQMVREQQEAAAGKTPEQISRDKSEMDITLSRLERAVLRSIETTNDRVAVHEALLHLVVAGNVLLYVGANGLRCFHLNRYVVTRDPMGNPMEAVACEEVAVEQLPAKVQAMLREEEGIGEGGEGGEGEGSTYDQTVRVYTHIEWEKSECKWYQEVKGKQIPDSTGTARLSECPWLALRMYRVDGLDYSPGYVEAACMADLQTADALSQAVAEGSLVSAQVRYLVNPAGVAKAKDLAEAANGAYLPGRPDDVTVLQTSKAADLNVAMAGLARVEARLAQAFMLADVRDSERTTAEEVRLHALQIENSLGSIYSILTVEFQQPYVNRKLSLLMQAGRLPRLPDGLIKPVVSVGLAAVGRGNDLEKTARFMTIMQQTLGPDAIGSYVMPLELIRRLAGAMGMDTIGLVKTDEQLQEEQQQAAQQAMAQQAMAAGMGDPQKVATAAATAQQMAEPPTTTDGQPPDEAVA